ncbi:hypothetical protein BJV77DRAFT_1069946 [Russula vinacea]|nr:hypothetical protein BJV77DRAFT_1069946 [Russula vinacea]
MINFHDPVVEDKDNFALVKLWLVVDGLFIWEFITTFDFEWSIIRGHRRYRWTIWIYSLSRVAALATVIATLVLFNTDADDCQLSETITLVLAYLALAAASFLLVLRIVAIWKRNIVAVGTATTLWVINGAFFIQGISQKELPGGPCEMINVQATRVTMIIAFLTDVFLLIIMLIGLFRLDCHRPGALATGRFLWNQSVIWLLLATVAGVVPTVFACLNLNEPLSMIFRFPWVITMSIAATRMYRGLDDFLSSDTSSSLVTQNIGRRTLDSGTWGTPAVTVPIPLNGIVFEAGGAFGPGQAHCTCPWPQQPGPDVLPAPMAPPLRLCGVQRVPHSRAALAIRTQRVSDIDGHARRLSRPAEACAATQDGSQTLDGQEHAVAREAGGVAPRVSTQPSALRLSTKIEQESYDPAPANLDTAAASQVLKSPSIYLQDLPAQRRLTQQD